MNPLYRLLLIPAFVGLTASVAFADEGPVPVPYPTPPSPLKWIPGPCPAPHTDVEKPDTGPRPVPYVTPVRR